MAKKKLKLPKEYEKAHFYVNPKRYKSSFVYRFNVNCKMYAEKLPSLVYIVSIVVGLAIMGNVEMRSSEYYFGTVPFLFGFFGLLAHWSNPDSNYSAKDLENSIKFHAWSNNKCPHCWKKVSKAAKRCPHCTSDISSIF